MRFVKANVGPRFSLRFRQGIVSNESIGPEVDHFNLQSVRASLDCTRDLHAPGRTPNHTKVFAVKFDTGGLFHGAESEEDTWRVISDQ